MKLLTIGKKQSGKSATLAVVINETNPGSCINILIKNDQSTISIILRKLYQIMIKTIEVYSLDIHMNYFCKKYVLEIWVFTINSYMTNNNILFYNNLLLFYIDI